MFSTGSDIDEDELEKELEELEQEELDKELLGVSGPATELPEVPTGELKDKTKVKKKGNLYQSLHVHVNNLLCFYSAVPAGAVEDDDEDMKQLMSWAN